MLTDLAITDLTRFTEFVYWPVRNIGDDCVETVKDGSHPGDFFSVYGKHWLPGHSTEIEEWVADFTTLNEAAAYCLMLNHALQGRVSNMKQYDGKP
jgi:hypothetical protein